MRKRYLIALIALLMLCSLLAGCGKKKNVSETAEKNNPQETESINGIETGNNSGNEEDNMQSILPEHFFHEDGEENEPDMKIHNSCLISLYDEPADVDLKALFYGGFGLKADEEDRSFLERQGANLDLGEIVKLPGAEMDRVLMECFGITRAESDRVGLDDLYYNEDTDTYYDVHGDTNYFTIRILEQYLDENGDVNVVYAVKTASGNPKDEEKRIAVLKKKGESYVFYSNGLYYDKEAGAIESNVMNRELAKTGAEGIEEFLLSHLEYKLPEDFSIGEFEFSLDCGDGYPILNKNGERVGGIAVLRNADAVFKKGRLMAVDVHSNGSTFETFTAVGGEVPCAVSVCSGEANNVSVNDNAGMKKYWYAFWAQENKEPVYALYLAADDLYMEDDFRRIVWSISFSEGAFLTKLQMAVAESAF